MTYLEAAITVLRSSSRPVSTAEIMQRITRDGLVPITGRTPEAMLYRNLGKHPQLRREAVQGPSRAAKGTVRLDPCALMASQRASTRLGPH
jgi:HB1, ASXL, restriction endonuclease HTH domain